jgi:septum formation protein
MKIPPFILASASPRRAELLRFIGCDFVVAPSHAEEVHNEQLTGAEVAHVNAYRKARSVAKHHPDRLVMGADTVVYLGRRLFGKPATLTEAAAMLMALEGRTHYVVTAICLLHLRAHRQRMLADVTAVTFRHLTRNQVRDYLSQINPLDKAGAYAIQEKGEKIVERVDGSLTNVVGLPLEAVEQALARWGTTGVP